MVEILSGGVKHDTECAEAMEAYLERIKVTRTLALTLPLTPTPSPNPTPTALLTPTPSPSPSPTPTPNPNPNPNPNQAQQRLEGVLGELPDLAVRLEAARADHGLRRKLMEECRSKSIALLDRLRAGVQKALPDRTPITEPEP